MTDEQREMYRQATEIRALGSAHKALENVILAADCKGPGGFESWWQAWGNVVKGAFRDVETGLRAVYPEEVGEGRTCFDGSHLLTERIAALESELAAAHEQAAYWKAQFDDSTDEAQEQERARLIEEKLLAKAENANLRAVVEAAKAWRETPVADRYRLTETVQNLIAAVDALEAGDAIATSEEADHGDPLH